MVLSDIKFRFWSLAFLSKERGQGEEREELKEKRGRREKVEGEKGGQRRQTNVQKKMRNKHMHRKIETYRETHKEKEQTRAVNCFQGVRNQIQPLSRPSEATV
jgi:hypothetical protein